MKIPLIVAAALICLSALCCTDKAIADEVNDIMTDAGDTMLRILPSLYSDDPDRTLVMENLIRLDYLFNQAEPHFVEEQEGAQVTFELLRERLRDAIQLGERHNINLMRSAVDDAFGLCASCHTQDRRIKRAFGVSKIRALDEYLAGEFSYLTRDYESALTSFTNYLESDKRTLVRDANAFDRALVITAEVLADPALARDILKSMLKHVDEGNVIHRHTTDWISALDRLATEPDALTSPLGKKSVDALDGFLDHEWPTIQATLTWAAQEAYWVVIRSELNGFLSRGASGSDVPRLLYWLGVSDRALQYRFYGSLSKGYLEKCIEAHPTDPYAKRCLEEYEMLILVSFSGSGGTNVPLEVRSRLAELRAMVYR
ncbi:MAG: hypothetical protein WD994_06550 [Pseudomonadales bacterium]